MWLSVSEGAEYLIRKYGAAIAGRLDRVPPVVVVMEADGRRGYQSADLDAWAEKAARYPRGRGAPIPEATQARGARDENIIDRTREWMNNAPARHPRQPPK